MLKKVSVQLVMFFLGAVLIVLANNLAVFQEIQGKVTDTKFVLRGPITTSTDIVIAVIDKESSNWIGKFPWKRTVYATLIDQLSKAGARVIAFDILFNNPTSFNPQDDIDFAASIKKAGNIILCGSFQNIQQQAHVKYVGLPYEPPIAMFEKAAIGVGLINPYIDRDNVVRAFQVIAVNQGVVYPYLAVEVFRRLYPTDNNISYAAGIVHLGGHAVKLNSENKLIINYRGPAQSFPHVPVSRITDGSFMEYNPGFFKNKIVFIGASDFELHDLFPTPFSQSMPGVEIHANMLQTILDANYILQMPWWLNVIGVFFLLMIAAKMFLKFSPLKSFLLFIVVMVVIELVDVGVFILMRYDLASVTFFGGLLFPFVAIVGYRYYKEEKDKKLIKGMFSQYVAESVVNELLKDPSKIKLGGEKKFLSIFFSDIRAFTTFSEAHTPEEVVRTLNEYLDAMTEVIFDHKGTLDKYVGDEVMAIYGAPIELDNHAKVAVEAALAQLEALDKLNEKFRNEGRATVGVGMGIHSGEVVIGNIGSKRLKDYTVIGDSVNLAARLEAITRKYGTPEKPVNLIISEVTYQLVKEFFECRFVDEIIVKGKTIPVKIYEVYGRKIVNIAKNEPK